MLETIVCESTKPYLENRIMKLILKVSKDDKDKTSEANRNVGKKKLTQVSKQNLEPDF